jgi:hypothetical protein
LALVDEIVMGLSREGGTGFTSGRKFGFRGGENYVAGALPT